MSRLHLRASAPATPLPPINDASPAAPSAGPRAFAFGARKLQYVSEAAHTRAKYARCVQRAGRIRHAHHVPPTSTAAFSPTSRAGPSPSCDPSPRHAQATAQAQNCVDGYRVTAEKSRGGARVIQVWKKQPRKNRTLVEMGRALFHHASAALDGSPKRYRAMTGSRANPITNRACRIRSPSPLSRTTSMFLLRLPCRILSLLNSHFICPS
jgi:hypothetical protein